MESENKDIDFSKTILVDHFSRPYRRFVVQLVCSKFPGLFTFYVITRVAQCRKGLLQQRSSYKQFELWRVSGPFLDISS